jgi:hypothetical protein
MSKQIRIVDIGGQGSSMRFDADGLIANIEAFISAWSTAGVESGSETTPVAVTATAAGATSNVDKKAILFAKVPSTGENLRIVLPSPDADLVTYQGEKGERVEKVSGQACVDAWKLANGMGAIAVLFRWGKVIQYT